MSALDSILIDSTQPVYTLRVASKLTSTPTHSIRQYIDKGLIVPFKTKTNRHLFSNVDIQRLKCIRKLLDDQRLNVAGINALFSMVPCWLIKHCEKEERENCDGYHSNSYPCWMASNKGPKCLNTNCRTCDVYRLPERCTNIKDIFKDITNT